MCVASCVRQLFHGEGSGIKHTKVLCERRVSHIKESDEESSLLFTTGHTPFYQFTPNQKLLFGH